MCLYLYLSFAAPMPVKYPIDPHTHTTTTTTTNPLQHNQHPIPQPQPTPNHSEKPNIKTPLWTDTLKSLIKQHYDRINKLEDQKYDLEYVVKRKDVEVHEHHQFYIRHLNTPKSIHDQNQKLTLNNNNINTPSVSCLFLYI